MTDVVSVHVENLIAELNRLDRKLHELGQEIAGIETEQDNHTSKINQLERCVKDEAFCHPAMGDTVESVTKALSA